MHVTKNQVRRALPFSIADKLVAEIKKIKIVRHFQSWLEHKLDGQSMVEPVNSRTIGGWIIGVLLFVTFVSY